MLIYIPIIGILVVLKGRFLRFFRNARTGGTPIRRIVPFERVVPGGRPSVLIAGDSTAVGIGSADPLKTIAGYFAQDFPAAHVRNVGKNGIKSKDLIHQLRPVGGERFDLIVMLAGGNDVVHGPSFSNLRGTLLEALDRAKSIGKTVVLMTQGNIGNAPISPRFLAGIYTRRARAVRERFVEAAREKGALFVDLFVERRDDAWLNDRDRYYGPDWFHPSGHGYRQWYERIREALRLADVHLDGTG